MAVTVKRQRAPRGSGTGHHKKISKAAPEDIQLIANTFCAGLSGIAVALTNNPTVVMTEAEQALIKPSLIATLEGMSDELKNKVTSYSNPIMLVAGLGLWGLRISGAFLPNKTAPRSQATPPPPPPPDQPSAVTVNPNKPTGNAADQLAGTLGGDL